ncbi:MAG: hypothetical protein ACRDP1_06460 [Nocardioidaceae bacterium]
MTTMSSGSNTVSAPRLRTGSAIMALGGLGFVAYGVILFVRSFTDSFLELGIGHEQVDVTKTEIERFSPDLEHYITHLHIAISGFVAAAGIAVAAIAWYGVRRGEWWAWVSAVVVPVVALAVALPAHYPWGFATIGHLGLIYADTLLFVVGAIIAFLALRERDAR